MKFWTIWILAIASLSSACATSTNTVQTIRQNVMNGNSPDQQLFFITTRIETQSADGKRIGVGTGFIIGEKIDDKRQSFFIVTCKHVVDGFQFARFSFIREKDGKPDLGQKCVAVIQDLPKWIFHNPDPNVDIVLIPLVPVLNFFKDKGELPFFKALDRSLVPTESTAVDLSAVQPILFMGYPTGLIDSVNFLPIARRGFTATPYSVDFNGLPMFLIDASVFPGSSGSPVLVFDQGSYATKNGLSVGSRSLLLGMLSQAHIQINEGTVEFKKMPIQFIPTYKETQFLNIGAVLKSKLIFETVDEWRKANKLPSN